MYWNLRYRDQHSVHNVVIATKKDDESMAVRVGQAYVGRLKTDLPNPNQNFRYVGVERFIVADEAILGIKDTDIGKPFGTALADQLKDAVGATTR